MVTRAASSVSVVIRTDGNSIISRHDFTNDDLELATAGVAVTATGRNQHGFRRPTARRAAPLATRFLSGQAGQHASLVAEGIPTAKGGRWHASTVRHVCMSVQCDAELEAIAA